MAAWSEGRLDRALALVSMRKKLEASLLLLLAPSIPKTTKQRLLLCTILNGQYPNGKHPAMLRPPAPKKKKSLIDFQVHSGFFARCNLKSLKRRTIWWMSSAKVVFFSARKMDFRKPEH